MDPTGTVAHTMIAAHAERTRELARLFGALERVAAAKGAESSAAREAYARAGARIGEWEVADREAERRDVVALSDDEREALRRDVARAVAHAQGFADVHVIRALQAILAAFPPALTRAALVRFRRSAARVARLEELRGPAFSLGGEAPVMLGAIASATEPIAPTQPMFDPADGFRALLEWGLETCAIREPGAMGAADLGLGTSPRVAERVDVSGQALYPFVPRARFCAAHEIGWAADEDATRMAIDLRALGGAELEAVAARVEAAAQRGHALVGLIEELSPESDGQRTWLVDSA